MSSRLRVYPLLTADWSDLDRVGVGPWTCDCGKWGPARRALLTPARGCLGRRLRGGPKPCSLLVPGWETPLCAGQTLCFLGGNRVEVSSSLALCETTRRHALCRMLATGWKFLCPRALWDKLARFLASCNCSLTRARTACQKQTERKLKCWRMAKCPQVM